MIIFILGNARSGTNMLGRLLDSHPRIVTTIEEQPIFDFVSDVAIRGQAETIVDLVAAYQDKHNAHPIYADKSHHAMWCAPALESAFPDDARFLAIERNPFATVASMIRHPGVLWWCEHFEQLPEPCPFLGLQDRGSYRALSMLERCALRCKAHRDRLRYLGRHLESWLCLRYEELVTEPEEQTDRIADFVGLENAFDTTLPHPGSVARWETELSAAQIAAIQAILTESP